MNPGARIVVHRYSFAHCIHAETASASISMEQHMATRFITCFVNALAAASIVSVTACSGYSMSGRVVEGDFGSISFIAAGASDELEVPIEGATVSLIRDPESLGREEVARATTRADGSFLMPVEAFGAGYLQEQWLVRVRHPQYQIVESFTGLPKEDSGLELLVIMPQGAPVDSNDNLMEQYDQFR